MPAFRTDSILPPPPEGALPILHDREYRVRAYRLAPDRLLIQGGVRDQKPPGLYIPDDPEPLIIHHMQLSLTISFPELVIVDAVTHFEAHPEDLCPTIETHYERLIGLSIARGFTHQVRELFGGPRGCTHTTALLQAMAPVAVQCFWSMRFNDDQDREPDGVGTPLSRDPSLWRRNLNTCHVWAEDGDLVAAYSAGVVPATPVFLARRLAELGRSADGSTIDPSVDR